MKNVFLNYFQGTSKNRKQVGRLNNQTGETRRVATNQSTRKKCIPFLIWRKSCNLLGGAWQTKTSSVGLGSLPCWSSRLPSPSSSWPRQSSRIFPTVGEKSPDTEKPSGINLLQAWIDWLQAWETTLKSGWIGCANWSQTFTTPSKLLALSSSCHWPLSGSSSTTSGQASVSGSTAPFSDHSTTKEAHKFQFFILVNPCSRIWLFLVL